MRRIGVIALCVLVLALGFVFETCGAQERPRFVVIDTAVRNRLAEEWHDENRYQRERAYCASVKVEAGPLFDRWRVTRVERAQEIRATPSSVIPVCDDSTDAILHVHPPHRCRDLNGNDCALGEDEAYQCQPSPADLNFLRRSRRKLDLVQCGRTNYVPYFRDGAGFY